MTTIEHVRCEALRDPIGLGVKRPRFSYYLSSEDYGVVQKSRRITASTSRDKLLAGDYDLWDSGFVESSSTLEIVYEGAPLRSRAKAYYRIISLLADGMLLQSGIHTFEMGLLRSSDFTACWISYAPDSLALPPRGQFVEGPPAPIFRKSFTLDDPPQSARLYITALGLYSCTVNAAPVTDAVLAPGWTDYDKILYYQTYDVTSLLRKGANVIAVTLGEGWYSGCIGLFGRGYYGSSPALWAQLEVDLPAGDRAVISTDSDWKAGFGAVCSNDLFMGERQDARLEPAGWQSPGFDDSAWDHARKNAYEGTPFHGEFAAQTNEPMRIHELLHPIKITSPSPGTCLCDMGQNMVGWVRLRLNEPEGRIITLRFGEMLRDDGSLYTDNLRLARATDEYISAGGEAVFEPHFTFHGFRYVEISGLSAPPAAEDVTGCVIHSALERTGRFSCSDPLVNRLAENILWGQKGNFLDVATDCPQRDERLGWTGDTQVFARSACYFMDMAPFYTKTSLDCELGQRRTGAFPDVAPYVNMPKCVEALTHNKDSGNPAWAECGIIVPYTLYLFYGDTRILSERYHSMEAYIRYLVEDSEGFVRRPIGYSDWLSVGDETPPEVTGTAFFAYSAHLMQKISAILGLDEAAGRYGRLFQSVRSAFCQRFVDSETGRIYGDSQTCYLLAIQMELVDPQRYTLCMEHLKRRLRENGGHLSCGFVGVSYLLPVLCRQGEYRLAYDLLLERGYPSWLYSVLNGATTVWERWNSYTRESGFGDVGMNSFNHYSLGSIAEWLFGYCAGIRQLEDAPGFTRFGIEPVVDDRLPEAAAEYRSAAGLIQCSHRRTSAGWLYRFKVPANTSAEVRLPLTGGGSVLPLCGREALVHPRVEGGFFLCTAPSGQYEISIQ